MRSDAGNPTGVRGGAPPDRPAIHRLSADGLRALLGGDGDAGVIGELSRAERSRRMLLLRAFLDRAEALGPATSGHPTASVTEAWDLLVRTQRVSPEVVEAVLMAPGAGTWVSSALRRLRDRDESLAPLWAVTGHLASLAATAATRAGVDFSLSVPAHRGFVPLPGVGCAVLPAGGDWAGARISLDGGDLRIAGEGNEVRVGTDFARPSPGWLPARRLVLTRSGSAPELLLDEHGPYRTFAGPSVPRILSDSEALAWESALADAWSILGQDEPTTAGAMGPGLASLAPAAPRERFRPYSSSAGEAFGGVNASLPDSGAQLAATLVHEFQHIKLGALTHLEPLLHPLKPASEEELFYAPWRDDPRPLEGLLQGIYAFFGVARFWRAHMRRAEGGQTALARFEFALWREKVWSALRAVQHQERLTLVGGRLLEILAAKCAQWLDEEVSDCELRIARQAIADHRARWREHHLRPSSKAVSEAVRAWRRGDGSPPAAMSEAADLVPDRHAAYLDTAAVLARHRLTAPEGDWTAPARGAVRGAWEADILLARGERASAARTLLHDARAGNLRTGTWSSLGLALAGDPAMASASRLLIHHPERARSVYEAWREEDGERPDPVSLAGWLGGADSRDDDGWVLRG